VEGGGGVGEGRGQLKNEVGMGPCAVCAVVICMHFNTPLSSQKSICVPLTTVTTEAHLVHPNTLKLPCLPVAAPRCSVRCS
jgi:hypothetical protein